MRLLFLLVLCFACAQMPKDQLKDVETVEASTIIQSSSEALKNLPVSGSVSHERLKLEFTKDDKLMMLNGKRAPVKHIQLVKASNPNLLVYGVHKSGWRKDSGVFPALVIFKDGKQISPPNVKKIHYDGMCAMHACRVTTLDISTLANGTYDVIIAAYVNDAEKPADMRDVESMMPVAGTVINQKAIRPQFATYFGDVMLETKKD